MCSVSPRLTANPSRDCRTTNDVGRVVLVGSLVASLVAFQPGARTTYAVFAEAGTVLCGVEEEPGGTALVKVTACHAAP
jgi:hypothetical protein